MLGPVPAAPTGTAARRTRSVASYVEAGLLVVVGLAAAWSVLSLLVAGVDVAGGVVLIAAAPLLAITAAVGLLLPHRMARLGVIAAAIGGMVVMIVVTQVPLSFVNDRVYLLAGVLVWVLVIFLIASFVSAWHESELPMSWAVLMLTAGGAAGLVSVGFLYWLFLAVWLLTHPFPF